jgi:hypothetical protein
METWDEEKLRNVVTENGRKQRTTTDVSQITGQSAIEHRQGADRLQVFHSGYRGQEIWVVVSHFCTVC